jgi:exoribonuclease-2
VRITGTDLLTLDVHASVLSRIDDPDTTADDAVVEDAEAENEDVAAGPLTLAIDVAADDADDAPADAAATTPAA